MAKWTSKKSKPSPRIQVRSELGEYIRKRLHEHDEDEREAKNELLAIWAWIRRRV